MNLVFVTPSWLWLLCLVPLFWFLPQRAVNRRHAAIRSGVVVLLVLALARPALLTEQDETYQVLVFDRSESVVAPAADTVGQLAARLGENSRVRVVTLDGDRTNAADPGGIKPMSLPGSSAGRALKAGARLIPEGALGAITLVSDGLTTDPHWGDAVRQLVERKIPVHTVAVTPPGDEIYPCAIDALPPVRVGQTTRVTVDVVGTAKQAVVSLMAGKELLARSTPFSCEGRAAVTLEFEPSRAGLLDVLARVQVLAGTDSNPDNNDFRSTLAVQEPIRALYLAERVTNSRARISDLLGPGVDLVEPSAANITALAGNPDGIAAYDLIVIDDRPAESVPLALQQAIVKAVRDDGVGLFYAGGKGAYGSGGYFDTPIASILPVEMIQKEEKRDPSTTLVVIIDTSSSMSGGRIQLAKECARLAIRRLLPHDKIGIVEFHGTKQWAAPIQSAANAIDIQRALNRLDAGGGTVIMGAIEEAFYGLQNVQTRYKHVLVLTDGGVEGGNFETLLRQMTAKGITTSTVLVGSDAHSEFLVSLANWGKGHFYSAANRFSIPEILLKQPSTSKLPTYRPGVHSVSMGGTSGWWGEISRPEDPTLAGYVETRPRPGAQVVIETEGERHPVLASWRHGLGRVSALTTEPVGEGTAPWRAWDGYGAWLMRVLARTAREHPQPFAYTIERSPNEARIVARRLTKQSDRPRAELVKIDGEGETLAFQQRSPDDFTSTLLADPATTLHILTGAEDQAGRRAHLVSPPWQAVAPEHNVDPAHALDLARLASATGGRSVPLANLSGLDPTPGGTGTATDLIRLWPWCLILALLAYFGDLLFRRWPGSRALAARAMVLPFLLVGFALMSAPEAMAEISPALETQLQRTLAEEPFQVDDGLLYRAALQEDKSLDPLLQRLDQLLAADPRKFETIWLTASLRWRYGLPEEALPLFTRAANIRPEALPLFRVAQLLDATGSAAEAAEKYQQTLQAKPDAALAGRIQLRLAILKSSEANMSQVENDLSAFARTQDQAFQNRAGVILALTGKTKEALALYRSAEAGDQVFKQSIRIAEWSMTANDMDKAREAAWNALCAANLKRDRLYALTVLSEAYRTEGKLDQLIARFAATPDLSDEARMAWIDLLREQGAADKALALFQQAKADGGEAFTGEMRREMLEICREAGRDDLLVENFREMIAGEPLRLEWRSGLSRYYLERGERDKGLAVWDDYRKTAQRGDWLAAAGAAMELGLDELAVSFAEELVRSGEDKEPLAALQFLFDLHKARARDDSMRAVLDRMDKLAAPGAAERSRIAESWEQLGRQDKAVEILEKLRNARGPNDFSPDLETRLAWLYSETGAEEKAYETWKHVWLRIDSPGRRRYVEDRLMATAARLGKIADIAIELEEKLADGTADKRDSSLLVRLYAKVGDAVSAAEIIQDFMRQSGGTEVKMLEEQAAVYVMCNEFHHYEQTIRKLMALDPAGTADYLTQLAMSALERGRNDEAQTILGELRGLKGNPASAEFEAGVYSIAGMHAEAAAAYWRGVAEHPERIDGYLLLGRSLLYLDKMPQAAGLFQYLVENADQDDLFTIAIDGLLNMTTPEKRRSLPPETLRWARRAILERLAGNDDKLYLFQLLSDVSEEMRDQSMMIRTLAETLPIAGERRTTQLRELMELSKVGTRNKPDMLRFGRRLIGMAEIIPPQVYLELGSTFLESGDVRSAAKTFDQADGGPDPADYRRKVADTFGDMRYVASALRAYEQLLITAPDDASALLKVGELKEQTGRDAEASIAYRRALEVMMATRDLFNFKEKRSGYNASRSDDGFDKLYPRVLTGFIAATDPGGKDRQDLIASSLQALTADLASVAKERGREAATETLTLDRVPRVAQRSKLIRRIALPDGHLAQVRAMEEQLLRAFPEDKTLLPDIFRTWNKWGYGQEARKLAKQMAGGGEGRVSAQLVRSIMRGDEADVRARLSDMKRVSAELAWEDLDVFLASARWLDDPAAIEQLTRVFISRTPRSQRLETAITLFGRVFSSLSLEQREGLIAHLGNSLNAGAGGSAGGIEYSLYSKLKELTGGALRVPIGDIRGGVAKVLAQGGPSLLFLGPMFSFLSPEDFQTLLNETLPKAKSSDRLGILFTVIREYPGKMDAAAEAWFTRLVEEALGQATEDPFRIYSMSMNLAFSGGTGKHPNGAFEAELLRMVAKRQDAGFPLEPVLALVRSGDIRRAADAAGQLLKQNAETFDGILRTLPPECLTALPAVLDEMEKASGPDLGLEKKRLQLLRKAAVPGRLIPVLTDAIRKFPKDVGLREELREELEKEGRFHEAIVVLEGLVELEPEQPKHRVHLQNAWFRLAHPVKARAVPGVTARLRSNVEQSEAKSRPIHSQSLRPQATAKPLPWTAVAGQEAPLPPPSTEWIKEHYEAGKLEEARLDLRQLWRRFEALDQASRGFIYRNPTAPNNHYYDWPGQAKQPPVASSPPSEKQVDLKAFLERKPPTRLADPQPPAAAVPTLFSVIGSEEFAAGELAKWLQTIEPQDYLKPPFEEILRGVVARQLAVQGAEPFILAGLDRFQKGELGILDQNALILALELQPEAGGEAADRFLAQALEAINPSDLSMMLRLARCHLSRGNEHAAIALYRWCATRTGYTDRTFSNNPMDAAALVDEIRRRCTGPLRTRALAAALPQITCDVRFIHSAAGFPHFILSIWADECAPHEVYPRCPEICREVVQKYAATHDGNLPGLDLATLFLAAGGQTDEALKGLSLLIEPPARARSFRDPAPKSSEDLLQLWLPEDMAAWTGADRWLSGVAAQIRQWETDGKLSTADAMKILSLVAVRQHQNRFEDAARATLALIGTLPLTHPEAGTWFIDAAEITGDRDLSIKLATTMLQERRLPVARVAPLMETVAQQRGLPAALELAEATLDYTMERGFLETMAKLSTAAGDDQAAQLWQDRVQMVQEPGTPAPAPVSDEGRIASLSEIDPRGIAPYTGAFEKDIRFQAALAATPKHIEDGYGILERRLGIDLRNYANLPIFFKDSGFKPTGGVKAHTRIVGGGGKQNTTIEFFTEYVVNNPEVYRRTVVHEMKHAGFAEMMGGRPYGTLPGWIKEGLAIWGSEDVDTRVTLVLANNAFSGGDPMRVLDGIEEEGKDNNDFLEGCLAFEWLESRKAGNVKAFCQRLVKGEPYRGIWADVAGTSYEKAIALVDEYCRQRVKEALGEVYATFVPLQKGAEAAVAKGGEAPKAWLAAGGEADLKNWLETHGEHPAAPAGRLWLGRALIDAGRHDDGRAVLQLIIDEDVERCTLLDDAYFFIGYSYNLQHDAKSLEAFGVLLRDFPYSVHAKQFIGKLPPAGPVTR